MDHKKLAEDFADHIVDGLDFEMLVMLAKQNLYSELCAYSEDRLIKEVSDHAPHLLGD